MASKKLQVLIDILTGNSKRDLEQVSAALGEVADSADDGLTAGQRLAAGLALAADKIVADLDESARAADALANALGPEMAAKIGRNGIDDTVADLKRAGLTIEDIEADADALAVSVSKLYDAGQHAAAGLRDIGDAHTPVIDQSRRLGTQTDNTRSVFANFTGNAMQELPGVAGAFGPLNMAISQFGEYAAEGNIKLRSLVGAIPPIAAGAVFVKGISDRMREISETKAFKREQIEGFLDGLREGQSALEVMLETWRELGTIEFRNPLDETVDLVPILAKAGISVEQFAGAIANGEEGLARLEVALKAAGFTTKGVEYVMYAAQQAADGMAEAQMSAADIEKVFGDETKTLTDAIDDYSTATQNADTDTGALGAKVRGLGGNVRDVTSAMADYSVAAADADEDTSSLGSKVGEMADETDRAAAAWGRLYDELDAESTLNDVTDGFEDIKTSAADAYSAAESGSEDASDKARTYRDDLLQLKETVARYAEEVLGLPAEQITDILALLDEGKFDEAQLALVGLAMPIEPAVKPTEDPGARSMVNADRLEIAQPIYVPVIYTPTGTYVGGTFVEGPKRLPLGDSAIMGASALRDEAEAVWGSVAAADAAAAGANDPGRFDASGARDDVSNERAKNLKRQVEMAGRMYERGDLTADRYLKVLFRAAKEFKPLSDYGMFLFREIKKVRAERQALNIADVNVGPPPGVGDKPDPKRLLLDGDVGGGGSGGGGRRLSGNARVIVSSDDRALGTWLADVIERAGRAYG